MTDFSTLGARLEGALLLPDDPGFAAEGSGFNLAVTHRPEAIVAAASIDDVVSTVRFARERGVPVRVQATGHGATTPISDGVLISTRRLSDVTVDPARGTATFGGGVPWAPVVAAAAEYGLAPVTGSSTTVGAVGYLLGGGLGPLSRSHGFSSDYLTSLRVVTGEGELVTASEDEHPDLFWALRGGKGGLGVVVEATVRLVPLRELYAGALMFDVADAPAVLAGWIAWGDSAPDDVSSSLAVIRFPDFPQVPEPLRGRHLVSVRFAYPGDAQRGAELAAPLRALAPVHLDTVGPLPVTEVARIHSDPTQPGAGWGWSCGLERLDADFVPKFLELVGAGATLPYLGAELRLLGGATERDVPGGSAVGGRDRTHLLHVIGVPDPALFAEVLPGSISRLREVIGRWISPTTTINWVSDPNDPVEFASAWPAETRERLDAVRRRHDPDGILPYGPAPAA